MELHIGKQLADGSVKYVTILNTGDVIPILKNFYCRESRIDALLALGNIVSLYPTPYGKSLAWNDIVHCRAEIRDDKEKKGKHLAKYADTIETYSKIAGFNLIYSDGRWQYLSNGTPTDIDFTEIPNASLDCFKGLSIYELGEAGSISKVYNNKCASWQELQDEAITNNKTFYIFRKEKLVATINHPLNQAI